jgi:hypothetical protein
MIAAFWHHQTQKGGNSRLTRSKIKPIALWILRLMLWKTGAAQKFFQQLETTNNYEAESGSDDSSCESDSVDDN